jgi:hypothetical protein
MPEKKKITQKSMRWDNPAGVAMLSPLVARIRRFARNLRRLFHKKQANALVVEQQNITEAVHALLKPQSAIFFTTHKCASTFSEKMFRVFETHSEFAVRNYPRALWNMSAQLDLDMENEVFLALAYDRLFKARGEIYVPLRKPVDFPGREKFRHVFFLRDPRDVLVSSYYSFGFSHAVPEGERKRAEFHEERQRIQAQGIDGYAREAATAWLLPVYNEYRRLRETAAESLYLKYDEFKSDTAAFVRTLAAFLEIALPDEAVLAIAQTASPVQPVADTVRHRRSGRSGQYLEALNPDTVNYLNTIFAEVLAYWEFDEPEPTQAG